MATDGVKVERKQPLGDVSNQAQASRRQLRGCLRKLHHQAFDLQDAPQKPGSRGITTLLKEAEALHEKVFKAREHAVDSELFATLAGIGRDAAKRAHADQQGTTPADLVAALRALYASRGSGNSCRGRLDQLLFNWGKLSRDVAGHCREAPGVGCMLGPLSAEVKPRRAPSQRKPRQQELAALVNPELLDRIEERSDKQETDRNMEEMWGAIRHLGPTPWGAVVLSHGSFSQTVENVFTLSFLLRDQWVRMHCDREEGLLVTPLPRDGSGPAPQGGAAADQAPAASSRVQGNLRSAGQQPGARQGSQQGHQFCLTFTMPMWDALCELFEPGECLMRDRGTGYAQRRPPADAAAAGPSAKRARRSRC